MFAHMDQHFGDVAGRGGERPAAGSVHRSSLARTSANPPSRSNRAPAGPSACSKSPAAPAGCPPGSPRCSPPPGAGRAGDRSARVRQNAGRCRRRTPPPVPAPQGIQLPFDARGQPEIVRVEEGDQRAGRGGEPRDCGQRRADCMMRTGEERIGAPWAANAATTRAVSSVEPSSTTTISWTGTVWTSTLSSAACNNAARL